MSDDGDRSQPHATRRERARERAQTKPRARVRTRVIARHRPSLVSGDIDVVDVDEDDDDGDDDVSCRYARRACERIDAGRGLWTR